MAKASNSVISLPSQDFLLSILDYNPETGGFVWKSRPRSLFSSDRAWRMCNVKYAGKIALNTIDRKGYRCGMIFGQEYKAHRVAWKMAHGDDPSEVDHINGDKGDNRIVNLRAVTASENCQNKPSYQSNSTGHTGVYWHKVVGKWCAQIRANRKSHSLGYFSNIEDAIAARKAAEVKFGFHPNHGRNSAMKG